MFELSLFGMPAARERVETAQLPWMRNLLAGLALCLVAGIAVQWTLAWFCSSHHALVFSTGLGKRVACALTQPVVDGWMRWLLSFLFSYKVPLVTVVIMHYARRYFVRKLESEQASSQARFG